MRPLGENNQQMFWYKILDPILDDFIQALNQPTQNSPHETHGLSNSGQIPP